MGRPGSSVNSVPPEDGRYYRIVVNVGVSLCFAVVLWRVLCPSVGDAQSSG